MEDWESEDFEPAPPSLKKELPKGLWDDEDVEEENVKESWEDEDASEVPKPQPPIEKTVPKASVKAGGKKAIMAQGETSEVKETLVPDEVLSDPIQEKLRQQRLVEEADYKSTAELFAKRDDEKTLDNFIPQSEKDFLEYAELISHKLCPYDKSFHYIGLLKAVMRLSITNMKAADAKEVASSITAIANEKLKVEKEAAAGKKKQGAKKKQLHVDKPDNDMVPDSYDALDDYDFM
uniref:Eukaryotic translation initiation factor 3 subunit J n=1 Tax=Anthurium amnicola TaxID=1678845 RepID=A0A1D1XI18_9ARAE